MKNDEKKHVAKIEKNDAVTGGIPLYLVKHSFFDSHNTLTMGTGAYMQTDCAKWVKRMGSILKKVTTLPRGHAKNYGVFIISDTIEDVVKASRKFTSNKRLEGTEAA